MGLPEHVCCNYDENAPRLEEGPYPGLTVTVPKAENPQAFTNALCSDPKDTFPPAYTKERASCDYCACLWYYGAPAVQRCCSVAQFGKSGEDTSGWKYCAPAYHVLDTNDQTQIHICQFYFDLYPSKNLALAATSSNLLRTTVFITAILLLLSTSP